MAKKPDLAEEAKELGIEFEYKEVTAKQLEAMIEEKKNTPLKEEVELEDGFEEKYLSLLEDYNAKVAEFTELNNELNSLRLENERLEGLASKHKDEAERLANLPKSGATLTPANIQAKPIVSGGEQKISGRIKLRNQNGHVGSYDAPQAKKYLKSGKYTRV